VKTFFAFLLTLGLLAASAVAQPTVTAVVNGASFSLPPLQNSSIAQGSFFTIFGTGIGPAASACGKNSVNCIWDSAGTTPFPSAANPLPTTMQGTSVSVTIGSNAAVPVYLEYVSPGQINAVLPSNTPIGSGNLTVTFGGTASAAFPITVVASSFGTFTWNESGTGPGILTNAVNYQRLTPFVTVKPADYVTIWGTGLGTAPNLSTEATAPPPQTNLCATASTCPVTVWVAGQKATVTYAGRSGFTAEDQIDFQVPPGVQGCYVQVAVQTGAATPVISNFTSMAVDPNGAVCQDEDGINFNDIASIVQSKGQANIGDIIMLSNFLNLSNLPLVGTGQWDNDEVAAAMGTFKSGTLQSFDGFALAPSVGNCTVTPFFDIPLPPPVDPTLAQVTFLNAGSLSIAGPNGNQPLPANSSGNGYYGLVGGETLSDFVKLLENGACPSADTDKCLPFFLSKSFAISPGTYTVTGTGGSGVGAISAPVSVSQAAAAFAWSNQTTITANPISRSTPLEIDWTGGDPNGFVDITAVSSTLASGLPMPSTPGVLAECIAPASLGKFTIPTYVLQSLYSTANSTAFVSPGELLVGPASNATKLTPPTGLDALYIVYHIIQGTNVTWQ